MTWGTPREWRSLGRRTPERTTNTTNGDSDAPERTVWIDTGSGPGLEVPESQAHRFTVPPFPTGTLSGGIRIPNPVPHTVPDDVQADALRATIMRHIPNSETGLCACGGMLGTETGLCRGAGLALERLMQIADEQQRHELVEEIEKYLPPYDDQPSGSSAPG